MEQTMMAVRLFEHGGPEVLKYIEAPIPDIGPDDVLLRVHATAVNSWDLRYRSGNLPQPLPGRPAWPLPFQLGRDAAGEIVATGENVTRSRVGDRVVQLPHPPCRNCALCVRGLENLCVDTAYPGHQVFGGYAQYVARRQDAVLPIPDGVDYETAAATMWTYTTPLNCARQAPVGPGDTVVITGASGGMAIACAQLARLSGATVIGTTTKPDRDEALRKLGYDHIVHSTDPRMPAEVRELTHGLGADAVWDCVGGNDFFQLSLACTRLGGTVIVLGTPTDQGSRLELDALALIGQQVKIASVRGATLRDQQLCLELLADKKITPIIDRAYPLEDAAEAHTYLESQRQTGKVILLP
ncbi:quinone oxidoreductase family protein [Streptomyces scabiei]|nr:zinc-binding dehydrogenase [Streptomyces scabiei]